MENVTNERSVYIGHGRDWCTTKSESELSNDALQHDATVAAIGYDRGIMDGKAVGRITGFVLGCTVGVLIGMIATTIMLNKIKNDPE